ncbi:MAG: alpha-amylase family glycosyl hydrolase, partial [Terriglobia bacterium]
IRLILDFVPNHTALDHPWIHDHPEYYIQGTLQDFRKRPDAFYLDGDEGPVHFIARGKDPYFPPWPDTAQLNYYNPATRKAMMGVLKLITSHCDGARCDMAMLITNNVFAHTWQSFISSFPAPQDEFWPAAVAAFPEFVWIAEVYWDMEAEMRRLGFSFCYDKRLYDRLLESKPQDVRSHLTAGLSYQSGLVRFLENHDERRSAAAFGREKLPAVAALTSALPGLRFYHQGQLEGKRLQLPIQLRRASHEPVDGQIQELYRKLLRISQELVFHQGDWRLLEVRAAGDDSSANIIAYQWRLEKTLKLVVANLASAPSQGNISLDGCSSSRLYKFYDQLNDRTYEWQGNVLATGGLFVRLDAYRSHIFDVTVSG